MLTVAAALAKALNPDRLNYELLGNAQAHLHWHIVHDTRAIQCGDDQSGPEADHANRLTSEDYQELKVRIPAQLLR